MLTKQLNHTYFQDLQKSFLWGLSAKVTFRNSTNIRISFSGKSNLDIVFAEKEIKIAENNIENIMEISCDTAYQEYLNIKQASDIGEYIEAELPNISEKSDIWNHMQLENIDVDRSNETIRLGYISSWDIEHDFGIYISNGEVKECGLCI